MVDPSDSPIDSATSDQAVGEDGAEGLTEAHAEGGDGDLKESVDPRAESDIEKSEAAEDEVADEVAVGSSDAGKLTNAALRALSRAARSFLLYEPRNQAIRDFLEDYRHEMQQALAAHGAIVLAIRPFEMVREGEVVYLERDRERSLAFRLFRDGVRRITIEPGVPWEELLRLLEILSIRYTSFKQSEDDIVTLLWKAGFKNIGIVAVEGFVPDEEQPAGTLLDDVPKTVRRRRKLDASQVDAPPDFDQPLPPFEEVGPVTWVEIPEEVLASLRAETSSQNLPGESVHLVRRLLEVVGDPLDPTEIGDVMPLVEEVRDFLLSEGQLHLLTDLVRVLESHRSVASEVIDQHLQRFADDRALRRILQSVSKGSETVPTELLDLLDLIPANHLGALLQLLVEERGTASRRLTRMLIEHFLEKGQDPQVVFERMRTVSPDVMADILRASAQAIPERALEEALTLRDHGSLEVQMEVLWVLGRSSNDALVESTLLEMLGSPHHEVRVRILEYLQSGASQAVYEPAVALVKRLSTRGITDRECQALGVLLASSDVEQAKPLLMGWVKPPGLFKRYVEMPGAQALQRTALYGLENVPGEDVDAVIRWLSERCSEDIYNLCMKTLVQRRKRGAAHER